MILPLYIIFFSAILFAVYEFLFKTETFFNQNRIYLLAAPVLAAILPFLKSDFLKSVVSQEFSVQLPEVVIGSALNPTLNSASFFSPIGATWILGMVVASVLLFFKILRLKSLRNSGHPEHIVGTEVVVLPGKNMAFTFLNRVYIGSEIEVERRKLIIKHELVHVKQRHGYDLFFFELLKIVLWFNPFVYLFQQRISLLHEYIADEVATKTCGKKIYYEGLLSEIFQTSSISFINTFFNQSIIKNRIIMLQKSKSNPMSSLKYLLIAPVTAALLFVVSCTNTETPNTEVQEKNPIVEITEIESSEAGKQKPEGVPFSVIDKAPVFPGCSGTNEELKQCMSDQISEIISKNFNSKVVEGTGVKGTVRIMVQFKIGVDGKIADIRARSSHSDIENEAIRVMTLIPDMKPGEQEGEKVAVLYSLPIIYQVE